MPALFYFSDEDQVIDQSRTREIAEAWGAASTIRTVTLEPGDDPLSHVIAGEIMSPSQTDSATQALLDWIEGL